jgi:hypothetical protein
VVLSGIVLGTAAMYGNKFSTQVQSYEARAGLGKTEVVIADEEISFPMVTCPDFFIALPGSPDKYLPTCRRKDLIVDEDSTESSEKKDQGPQTAPDSGSPTERKEPDVCQYRDAGGHNQPYRHCLRGGDEGGGEKQRARPPSKKPRPWKRGLPWPGRTKAEGAFYFDRQDQ